MWQIIRLSASSKNQIVISVHMTSLPILAVDDGVCFYDRYDTTYLATKVNSFSPSCYEEVEECLRTEESHLIIKIRWQLGITIEDKSCTPGFPRKPLYYDDSTY